MNDTKENAKIVYLAVDVLKPHPNNPRKDVGDVTELAESIKANGIMQNLTVIPDEEAGKYMVLIGHRRLAASKKAGLKEVPCVIAEGMPFKEQVAIMLAENMQRQDLTIIEQAEGIQMMLDLGDTVSEVAEKTGLSETTVRRRRELMEYDKSELAASVERGGTLSDYESLKKVQSPEARAELLKAIGTNEFEWKLRTAIDRQKREEYRVEVDAFAATFAGKVDEVDYNKMCFVCSYSLSAKNAVELPKKYNSNAKYYYCDEDFFVAIYMEYDKAAEDEQRAAERAKQEEERAERENRIKLISAVLDAMRKRREDFVQNFRCFEKCSGAAHAAKLYEIIGLLIKAEADGAVGDFTCENFLDFFDIDDKDVTHDYGKYVLDQMDDARISGERKLLIYAYIKANQSYNNIYTWDGQYRRDGNLEFIYDLLKIYGFKISDEETAMLNGTHEVYYREGTE